MIKPFIALAYFYKVKENSQRYRYDRKHRAIMEAMIRRSSNVATNHIMNLIASKPKDVERILKANAPEVFRQTSIVEKIPVNGRTYRNKASAHDYSRFLYGLWYDKFPLSRELKNLMHLPNKDRIYHGAESIPRTTRVYDKTGTTARLCGNMGILEARGRDGRSYPYTFIGIIQKSTRARQYGSWMRSRGDIIREVSNIVYTDLKGVHNLV
jgi:beta-lactamase class A